MQSNVRRPMRHVTSAVARVRAPELCCALRSRNAGLPPCHATAAPGAAIVRGMSNYTIDPGHSAVGFSVRHLMITNVRGEFEKFRGEIDYDAARPEATRIEATIDVASLSTREAKRDADLRSALFFDAETHPAMTFVSRSARAAGGGDLDVTGDLTIRGVTREVTLSVRDVSGEQVDMRGNARIGATASAKIKRSDFGMTWNKALETGGVVVGDVVTIALEVSLVKAPR
jgi:polyisoprenoid-binding protein YceI